MGGKTKKSIIVLLVLALYLSACRNSLTPSTSTTLPERTVQPPSRYATPPNTLTPPLPTPTRTLAIWTHPPLPLLTSTPSSTPTWTPLPTLSPVEAQALVFEMMTTNADCRLPCWWGMMPGITPWNEASQYLRTFTMVSGPIEVDFGGLPPLGSQVSYRLEGQSLTFSIGIDNGLIYDITVVDRGTDLSYQLDQLLISYGQPGEIYLIVVPATPDGPFFELFIHYPQQGILARYTGSAVELGEYGSGGEIISTGFRICPIGIGPELWLRPPGTVLVVAGNPIFGPGYSIHFMSLPSVTEMSLEDFYLTFRNADNSTCFETPFEDWP